jgi:hypothetical protein
MILRTNDDSNTSPTDPARAGSWVLKYFLWWFSLVGRGCQDEWEKPRSWVVLLQQTNTLLLLLLFVLVVA